MLFKKLSSLLEALAKIARQQLQVTPDCHFTKLREKIISSDIFTQHIAETDRVIQTQRQQLSEQLNTLSATIEPSSLANFIKHDDWHTQVPEAVQQAVTPRISIIGAGLSGLLSAYVLAKQGVDVSVYEKREQAQALIRPQNISFKEASERLEPMLGVYYQRCFERGGAMDGDTGKLRLTIGCFQEILLEALADLKVTVHYGVSTELADHIAHADQVIVAAGVHSIQNFDLQSVFEPLFFTDYNAEGRSALFIHETEEAHGYWRGEGEGFDWYRENKTIYSGENFSYDLKRVAYNSKLSMERDALLKLISSCSIDYTFTFGNDTPGFAEMVASMPEQPWLEHWFTVRPMMTSRMIVNMQQTQVIAMGDANGSAHPLAAIGTLKFIRNMEYLPHYVYLDTVLKQLGEHRCRDQAMQVYDLLTMKESQQVLIENMLACVFSEPRVEHD